MERRNSTKSCPTALVLSVLFVFFSASTPINAAGFCLPGADTASPKAQVPTEVDSVLQNGDAFGFFDANPNMRGFLSKEVTDDRNTISYKDLMNAVPHVLSKISNNVRYQKVTGSISPISSTNILQVRNPEFYQCQRGIPLSECSRTKTHLDQLMALAADLPAASFFVLASDLNIDGNLLLDNKLGSIKSSLETIMQSGRAVGILGFKMPFKGTIYNLPGGRIYTNAHSRPTFLIAIGARDKVLRFHELLIKDLDTSGSVEDNNFLIFTNRLIRKSLIGADWPKPFTVGKGVYKKKLWDQVGDFEQFTMSKINGGAIAKIKLTKIQTPHSLPIKKDTIKVSDQIWQLRKESGDCKERWLKLELKETMIEVIRKGEQFEFKLGGPKSVIPRLPKRRKYFIRTVVTAMDIDFDESLEDWVSGWSYDEPGEAALFSKQVTFFPSLNLQRFIGQLVSVNRGVFKPEIIASFNLGVSLER